eukprot:TRINITY_DN8236_c0_g1_i3.p1 TRINITY_DN8236_c0_g1~~TRINITY_DN8236_c0_g1_i3.p1  ORF type:complete len:385 (-),score=105.53 TRINITY_DN8236_c0_g1_i3:141-1295(-)
MYSATDLSRYNAAKMLHAFMEGAEVEPPISQTGTVGDHSEIAGEKACEQISRNKPADSWPNMKLVLLLGEPEALLRRQRYLERFDAALVANASSSADWSTLVGTLGPRGYLVVETAKFVLDLRKEHKTEFLRRVYESARESSMQLLPMSEKAHQGKGAPQTGEAVAHVMFVKPTDPEVPCAGTIEIPVLDKPDELEQQEPSDAEAAEMPPKETDEEVMTVRSEGAPQSSGEIRHGNEVEWQIVQRLQSRFSKRPRELLLRVKMPGVKSVKALELETEQLRVLVKHDQDPTIDLDIPLPFPIDTDIGSAEFDSDKSVLSITMPVLQLEEEPKNSLLHLEKTGGAEPEGESEQDAEHVMVREQEMRGGMGMAIPSKLGQNIFLGGV